MLNYYEIGQRVRAFRKERGLSQEELAEQVDISVTHMSHIETGNTKLSLPVLADLSGALGVKADALLFGAPDLPPAEALADLLTGCTPAQAAVILDTAKALKAALTKIN